MAGNYAQLLDIINNPTQHGLPAWDNNAKQIEGETIKQYLLSIINSLTVGYQFMGVASTNTSGGTPDQNVFYLAGPGIYNGFGSNPIIVNDGYLGVIIWNGVWSSTQIKITDAVTIATNPDTGNKELKIGDTTVVFDKIPQYGSTNLVESRGVAASKVQYSSDDELFDRNTAILGIRLNNTTGVESVDSNYFASPYIAVEGNETLYVYSDNYRLWCYDSNKDFLRVMRPSLPAILDSDVKFVRISALIADLGNCRIGYEFNENPISNYLLPLCKNNKKIADNLIKSYIDLKSKVSSGYYDYDGNEQPFDDYRRCHIDISNLQGKLALFNLHCADLAYCLFYDSNNNIIERFQQTYLQLRYIPQNAYYVSLCNDIRIVAIEDFGITIFPDGEQLLRGFFAPFCQKYFAHKGYWNSENGVRSYSTFQNYHLISDLLPIKGGEICYFDDEALSNNNRQVCWYDANKNFISFDNSFKSGLFIAPLNAHYVGICFDANITSVSVYIPSLVKKPIDYGKTDYRNFCKNTDFANRVINGNILVVGDSTIAQYSGGTAIADILQATGTKTNIATPGDTILGQLSKYNALSSAVKSAINYAFVQIGLNDVTDSVSTIISNYQSLLDAIKQNSPNAKIMIGTMNPNLWRIQDLNISEIGTIAWKSLNFAIENKMFHNVDYIAYLHTELLSSEQQTLDTIYYANSPDGIHENTDARKIIASVWLSAIGL